MQVKFDKFVEQGKVLHNYASILELLLRLRQCCDHPFLVLRQIIYFHYLNTHSYILKSAWRVHYIQLTFLVQTSRGDTAEYADLEKLARRLISGRKVGEILKAPTKAYIQEVVGELQKNEKTECPICLEAVEDAVLTPCAHCLCRECLLASWSGSSSGACPICRCVERKMYIFIIFQT